jgi:mannose-6-phosphate isomerase-like protein (cupin superfamily)
LDQRAFVSSKTVIMKKAKLNVTQSFRVVLGNRRSQAAEMALAAGETEGGLDNRHVGSDQWLYVLSGTGTATVRGKRYPLRAGTLILIEQGDTHQIRNTSKSKLRTMNIYVPPAYRKNGEPLPRGRSEK